MSTVENKIVNKVVISRDPPAWVVPRWAVDISPKNYVIKPYMQIRTDKVDDAETTLHELLHSYTHPYLYAWCEQLNWRIEITDPLQKQRSINHFIAINKLYKKAKDAGYKVINWSSIEESITEFVANLTKDTSVVELKRLWIYEPMMAELKKHKEWITSLEIPYTLPSTLKIVWTKIPRIWIWTFELWWSDKDSVENHVTSAINNGYRNIDTAQWYGNLKQVWSAVKKSGIERKEFFVTSKIRPNWSTKTTSSIVDAIQKQVNETDLWYIDLMLVHARDPALSKDDMKQVLLWFKEAKNSWLIKNIGVSNFDLDQLKRATTIIPNITCNQIECHPYSIPHDIIEYCKTKNIVVTAYSPFCSDNKWNKSKDDTKQLSQNIINNPIIKEIATHYPNKTLHQVVLRYLLQLWVMAIPASSNPNNQKSNLDIFDFFVTDEDMTKLATINKWKDWSIYREYYKNDWVLI